MLIILTKKGVTMANQFKKENGHGQHEKTHHEKQQGHVKHGQEQKQEGKFGTTQGWKHGQEHGKQNEQKKEHKK